MTEEQKTALLEKVKEEAKKGINEVTASINQEITQLKSNIGGYASKEDLDKRLETIEVKVSAIENPELKTELETLKTIVKEQGLKIDQSNKDKSMENMSFKDRLKAVINEKLQEIQDFKNSDSKNHAIKLNTKAILRAAITDDTMAYRLDGVGQLQRRKIYLRDLFQTGTVGANSHGVIRYTDQEARTDNTQTIAEGATYGTISDIDWIEKSVNIQKVGSYIKVSREMMDDVDFVAGEIQRELMRNVDLELDSQLLTGNGIAPNLSGLVQSATAYAAGSYAGSVSDASYYDLIAAISSKIQTATDFIPNAVLVNQSDAFKMKTKKNDDGDYVLPTFAIPTQNGNITIEGMLVVVNSGVAENTMYVGDFTRGTYYSTDDMSIEIGYEDDDFTKDLVTIKARERGALIIRSVDAAAFTYVSNISNAIAGLDIAV